MSGNGQLIEVLLKTNRIKEEQVARVLFDTQTTKEPLLDVLEKRKILNKNELKALFEKHFKVPYIELDKFNIDKDIFKILPEDAIRKYCVLPVSKSGNEVTIATSNPGDLVALENLKIITGYEVKPVVALEDNILNIIDQFYSTDTMGKVVQEAVLEKSGIKSLSDINFKDYDSKEKQAPIVKIVNTLIEEGIRQGASDIHFEPQESNVFVRYRIDGILQTKEVLPKEIQPPILSRIKIMGGMDISEKRLPQDGQTSMNIQKRNVDLRISTLPEKYGEKIVMRILDKSNFALGIEHLGFLPETQTKFEGLLNAKNGILLVTGPTGSGKTTTLYSALNKIKSSTKNIITLEDPVEYEILSGKNKECGIAQVQINPKVGLTFSNALRACLRQDPDVILVGEIRDAETCGIAINAALMGHLVLSTLHTNDAASTITRLLDMGVEPFLISSSLIGIVAQRLLRTLCVNCREKYIPPKMILEKLNIKSKDEVVFYRPKGCNYCGNSGYKGRTAVIELLTINDKMKDLILKKEKLDNLRQEAINMGMITMRQNGIHLVAKGVTTMAEVMRVVPFDM
ncbi:MAG: type II/IV secretion system protein [Endomicrobiales bacterium]|nr:type II/IV secretion system protein [Endomicrobiales bacterium]